MTLAEFLISTYIKVGCIGWIAMVGGLFIRMVYLICRDRQDIFEVKNAMDETTAKMKTKKNPWWVSVAMIVFWPWGLARAANNYSKLEKRFMQELQKRIHD